MIQKTNDYSIFLLREDNRKQIDNAHIEKLIESLKQKNMLELRPILVNQNMEVLDGQHRLIAAQRLGIEVYYQITESIDHVDIIKMNISKNWSYGDFLNFYCKNGYKEYIKLNNFMEYHDIPLRQACGMCIGTQKLKQHEFKTGMFIFNADISNGEMELCRWTCGYIHKLNGWSRYLESFKFWTALMKLIRHPDFDEKKWRANVEKLVTHFGPKVCGRDFLKMVVDIYNHRLVKKIDMGSL